MQYNLLVYSLTKSHSTQFLLPLGGGPVAFAIGGSPLGGGRIYVSKWCYKYHLHHSTQKAIYIIFT